MGILGTIFFTERNGDTDINLKWTTDGFDGPIPGGPVLAEATYPFPFNSGKVRFDETENWTDTIPEPPTGVDLTTVAMHELGHSLGLGHSSDPNAVMFAYHHLLRTLTPDDINGIQFFYGGWHDWEPLGGTLTSGPDVSSFKNNDLDVFVRGGDNAIWQKRFDDGWTEWKTIGGLSTSEPAAISQKYVTGVPLRPNYNTDVFVRGGDNALWHKRYFYKG